MRRAARDALPSALAIVPMLVLYAATAQRDVQFWDVGEMQTVPWILGIAHPTGFPIYVISGWLFSHAFALGSIAWRLSLFSSIAMCAASWFVYRFVRDEGGVPWVAAATALAFTGIDIVWSRGTRADVHGPALLLVAIAFFCAYRWYATGDARALVRSGLALGVGLSVHPVVLFVIPAATVLACLGRRRLDFRLAATSVVVTLAPLISYLYLPLRSFAVSTQHRDPTLALGLPPGAPFWDYAHPADLSSFVWLVTGAQFHKTAAFLAFLDPHALVASLAAAARFLWAHAAWQCALASLGVAVTVRRSPVVAAALLLLGSCVVPFAFAYLEEADKERYLLTSLFALTCLAGVGASSLARAAARIGAGSARRTEAVVAAMLVASAAVQVYANRNVVAINADGRARRYVSDVVAASPDDAVVAADWTYATPLAYAAYVDGTFGRRIAVALTIPQARRRFRAWSRSRCVLYASDDARPIADGAFETRALTHRAPYVFSVSAPRTDRCRRRISLR